MLLLGQVRNRVGKHYDRPQQSIAHRMDHIDRVMETSIKIASSIQNVDFEALMIATLLHDVDQPFDKKHEY